VDYDNSLVVTITVTSYLWYKSVTCYYSLQTQTINLVSRLGIVLINVG